VKARTSAILIRGVPSAAVESVLESVPAGVSPRALARFRVGLISVRFGLFDPQMPSDFPARMRQRARAFADRLGEWFDVVAPPLIESEADAAAVRTALANERLDAIVFAPTMAAPPSFAAIALADAAAPLVLWNAVQVASLGDGLSQAQATEHTGTVGALMLANVLVREGRPAQVVTTIENRLDTFEQLRRVLTGVAAAGALRGRSVLRVGDPVPGYLDVASTADDLARLGLTERAVTVDELGQAVAASSGADLSGFWGDCEARGWTVVVPDTERSVRLAVALRSLAEQTGAVCGTVNCHGPWFRGNPTVGVVACLGAASLTAAGCPIACTGDQPTAITLYLARRIAGAALYCECYAPDFASGSVLVVGGGEADPAWAGPGGVRVVENIYYPGVHGAGAGLAFRLRTGPATLLSLSPTDSGWVLAWATGEVVESRYARFRGPNGMFRFDSGGRPEVLSRWIGSGATHHHALAPGRLDVELPALADALGARSARV
jgi:L-arabinose isomerase